VVLAADATNFTGDETVAPLAGELIFICANEVRASKNTKERTSQYCFKT